MSEDASTVLAKQRDEWLVANGFLMPPIITLEFPMLDEQISQARAAAFDAGVEVGRKHAQGDAEAEIAEVEDMVAHHLGLDLEKAD